MSEALDIQPIQSVAASFIDEWERQPGEPKPAFTAFTYFRDMGDERGVTKVRDVAGGKWTHSQLMKWATRHRWVDRAEAFDRWLDRKRVAAHVQEVEAMARRQVQTGQALQGVGLEWVNENLQTPDQRKKNLTANTTLRYISQGVALEREGLGLNDKGGNEAESTVPNVLDATTEADVFDTITRMASNVEQVERMVRERGISAPGVPVVDAEAVADDIEDAELVEEAEGG